MEVFFYLLGRLLYYLLSAVQLFMLIRAVLSWFPGEPGGVLVNFLYAVTETVIAPVRFLLERFRVVRESPIDLSFFATFLLLSLMQIILQTAL